MLELASTPLLCALTRLDQYALHPVGTAEAGYGDVGITVAGGCRWVGGWVGVQQFQPVVIGVGAW